MQLSLLTVVSMILVLVSASAESISLRGGSMKRGLLTTKCSDSGSSEQYGGDCSATPTYCGRDSYGPQPQAPGPDDFWDNEDPLGIPPGDNVVSCRYQEPRDWYFEDDIPVEYSDARDACYKPDKRCNEEALKDYPQWCRSNYMMRFGGYHGGCSGTNNCLNLDFHCADGEYCGMSCTGGNSCEGLTMYCAANQFCEIQNCGDGTERCVGAKAVCGEGTVAQGLACVPMDQPNNCRNPILPLGTTYSPTTSPTKATIAPSASPTNTSTNAPTSNQQQPEPETSSPTSKPTNAPVENPDVVGIPAGKIFLSCTNIKCGDGSDGASCTRYGGCCPFLSIESNSNSGADETCYCGLSHEDAKQNSIPCNNFLLLN